MLKVLVASGILMVAVAMASADVIAPRVTTDKSVDTHSLQSIVNGICKPGMTEEQKAIALYEYTRRVMFHYEQRGEKQDQVYDLDALRLVNTYGYSFCTQQMLVLIHLWNTAGVKGRYWSVPGHSTAQAFYGGKTRWFDPLIGAYVYSREKGGGIASLKEIADDPTVLTKAKEEGRACPTFVPCGKVLALDAARLTTNAKYAKFCAGFGDDVGYMAANAKKAKKMGGPRRSLYSPDLTLRRGDKVTYLWDCIDGEYNVKRDAPAKELPPHHFCGVAADSKDKLNYKYWKPYVKKINGVDTCRYYANGVHELAPRFTNELFKKGFESNTFQWYGWRGAGTPWLRPKRAGRAANLVYKMSTPHVYTNATLTAEFHRVADEDVSRLYVSSDAVTWRKVWDAADADQKGPGVVTATAGLRKHVHGTRDFWVRAESMTKVEVKKADKRKAGLHKLAVKAIFQHNMFARPHLGAGKNKVAVRVANPETLNVDPFHVTYVWAADNKEQRHSERITKSPMTYTIDVPGKQMPKMIRLELSVAR